MYQKLSASTFQANQGILHLNDNVDVLGLLYVNIGSRMTLSFVLCF